MCVDDDTSTSITILYSENFPNFVKFFIELNVAVAFIETHLQEYKDTIKHKDIIQTVKQICYETGTGRVGRCASHLNGKHSSIITM